MFLTLQFEKYNTMEQDLDPSDCLPTGPYRASLFGRRCLRFGSKIKSNNHAKELKYNGLQAIVG